MFAPSASAGSVHNPAPIVYAADGAATPSRPVTTASSPHVSSVATNSASSTSVSGGERIQFHYPSAPAPAARPTLSMAGSATLAPVQMASLTAPLPTISAPILEPEVLQSALSNTPESEGRAPAERTDTLSADEFGIASWYGEAYHGAPTANGEIFDMNALTAAHPNLPLPSLVQVVNTKNNKEIVVRVNDRGPFVEGRAIDLSKAAAEELGFAEEEETTVRIRYLGSAAPIAPTNAAPVESIVASYETPANPEPRLPVADPVAPSTIETGRFYVQIGSFSDIANAQHMQASLSARHPVAIETAQVHGSDFFRVFVGPLGNRAAANMKRDHLAREGGLQGVVIAR